MSNETIERIVRYMKKWQIQLMQEGLNTKLMVKNDIDHLLRLIENEKELNNN